MRGEIFGEDVVHRDIECACVRDVGQAADDVVGIALALAAEHRIALVVCQWLSANPHCANALALAIAGGKGDRQAFESYEPSAETLRWIVRTRQSLRAGSASRVC